MSLCKRNGVARILQAVDGVLSGSAVAFVIFHCKQQLRRFSFRNHVEGLSFREFNHYAAVFAFLGFFFSFLPLSFAIYNSSLFIIKTRMEFCGIHSAFVTFKYTPITTRLLICPCAWLKTYRPNSSISADTAIKPIIIFTTKASPLLTARRPPI